MIAALFSLSTHTLQTLLDTWSYLAVFAFVGIESSGIPFPGETMLLTAAVYAGTGHLNIVAVIAASAAGAIVGDNAGYCVGRTGGRELALRYGRYIRLDEAKLASAERFFAKHGDKTVFFGRFIAILRAWAAFLAGLNRMPWWKFFLFNAAGGIAWSTLYGVLAFELGKNLPLLHRVITAVGYGGLAAVVVFAVAFVILRRRGVFRRAHAEVSGVEPAPPAAHETAPARAPNRAGAAAPTGGDVSSSDPEQADPASTAG